jgi:hypothetical protein
MAGQHQCAVRRKKKLGEVGLPLETINADSAREQWIRQAHPSGLRLVRASPV